MVERPILMSAPMVRATLENRKTQTRRLVKQAAQFGELTSGDAYDVMLSDDRGGAHFLVAGDHGYTDEVRCPYGKPGDRLWVREAWAMCVLSSGGVPGGEMRSCSVDGVIPRAPLPGQHVAYRADGDENDFVGRWRPSIHMPRWASRITLRITDVRVERLQDINEEDAKAEGVDCAELLINGHSEGFRYRDYSRTSDDVAEWFVSPIDSYRTLWESINGKGSWAANPVWVVGFERVEVPHG